MLVGVTRGLQMLADFLTLAMRILPTHAEAWPDFQAVASLWLAETTNTAGKVKVNPWSLIANGDPWKGSRKAWFVLYTKWGGK